MYERQRTYARLSLRRKGTKLTLPEMGKRRTETKPIDLFNEEKINAINEPTQNRPQDVKIGGK